MTRKDKSDVDLVKDIYEYRNMPQDASDMVAVISAVGLTMADVQANPDLVFEALIARNFRRACDALNISISPQQSLTLAKHLSVGAKRYRNGIPLSDHERSVALQLYTLYMRAVCEEFGNAFTVARDCERRVHFGERGLHIGHKIGEASGCCQVIVLMILGTVGVVSVFLHLARGTA